MPRLLLLRHAEAEIPPGTADADRPLSLRGHRDAEAMGRLVAARDWRPDLILCSPSRRTRETLVEVQKSLDGGTAVHFLPELYNGAENEYRAAIRRSGAEAACLLLIGHNPTIHQTALHLSASGSPGLIEQLRQSFPPAAFATIEVDGAWDAINSDAGRLVDLVTPEEAFRQLAL